MTKPQDLILNSNDPQPPKTGPEVHKLITRNTGITLLAIVAVIAASFFATSILLQLIFSFYLFFLLNPLVEWADRKKISRKLSSITVVLFMIVFTAGAGWGSYGALSSLAQEIPQYTGKIKKTIQSFQGQADEFQKGTNNIIPQSNQKEEVQKVEVVDKFGGGTGHAVLQGLGSIAEILVAGFLIPILVLFLLLEKPFLHSALLNAVPPTFNIKEAGRELSAMVSGFFFGNIVVGFCTAAGFYILFSVLQLENRLLLALLAGFINLIPMVGAVLGGIFPMAQAYLQYDTPGPALTVFGASVFLHFFVANFVIPKIVGSKINVNATAATIGLIFWGWLWGPLGLLLAVPLTATIRIFLSSQKSTEAWARLLSEDAAGELTRMSLPKQIIHK
jgi:predicted PurR-regulated permease PerM